MVHNPVRLIGGPTWIQLTSVQVHADASNFDAGVTKEEAYEQVLLQAEGLFYDQPNWVSAAPIRIMR